MKLTQSQRADLLAQFFTSKATAVSSLREELDGAKEMLQAYEDELASWPELPPPAYGPDVRALADSFRSDVPVPPTEEQAQKLKNLPPTGKPLRNPENIDFSKYPIPPGYTVASDEDCECPVRDGWLLFTSCGWKATHALTVAKSWTYLRPLRKGEK